MNEPHTRPLTVYIAGAPGAGKTYRLLQDARRLRAEGARVVIGWIETKNRPDLEELARDIPRIPPRIVRIGSSEVTDFDYDAALAAEPTLVLLDDLAHTNLEGARHAKRWQDAVALREAGISVSGTLNAMHLEHVAPVVEAQSGVPMRETVPMSFLRGADQVIALDASELHPDDVERARNDAFPPHVQRLLREMMLRTIDELTVPELSPAKTSTALALIAKDANAPALVGRMARIATALDLSPEIASVENDANLEAIATEHGARIISLPQFDPVKPNLADVKAALIVLPKGPLAQRIAAASTERDIFITSAQTPQASLERSLFSGIYAQTAGDRLRIGYGRLTIYVGASAGCGKTYAMLDRAHRLRKAGVDVVAAFVQTHRRADTEKLLDGLETLDLARIIARKPDVALIDDLAHTNAPGSRHAKRYDDIMSVLRAGISVITTLNIEHLEGLSDAVFRLTGKSVRETVPDDILRTADDVIFIDVTPEVLRERLRQGSTEHLAPLRELAIREVIRARGELPSAPPIARIALGVKGREQDIELIERCARLAKRLETELSVIHVAREREAPSRAVHALETAADRVRARWQLARGNEPIAHLLRAATDERADTIAVEGRQAKPRWPPRASFARRLLEAGAPQVFILTPRA